MQSHQQCTEKVELDEKHNNLVAFLATDIFAILSSEEQDLITRQCEHMGKYSQLLGERIAYNIKKFDGYNIDMSKMPIDEFMDRCNVRGESGTICIEKSPTSASFRKMTIEELDRYRTEIKLRQYLRDRAVDS